MKMQQLSMVYKQLSWGWQTLWQREDGANLVLMAFVIPVLIGFAGLAVDGSNIFITKPSVCRFLPMLPHWAVRVN